MKDLRGKVAVITGGSSGIGLGLAQVAIDEGMAVAISGTDEARLRKAHEELQIQGADIFTMIADVADEQAMDAFAKAVFSWRGEVSLLCPNAGVNCLRPLVDMTMDDWNFVMAVNIGGVFNTLRAFLPGMIARGGKGHILYSGSMATIANPGVIGLAPYMAAKMGTLALSLALDNELASDAISQTYAFIGSAESDMSSSALRRRPGRSAPRPSDKTRGVRRISAEETARMMIDGVKNNQRFMTTHPELLEAMKELHQSLTDAFPAT